MRAQFVEQDRAEHHVAILATLAALDVNDHALAVHVADFQASQLGVADSGGVESHEHGAIEGSGHRAGRQLLHGEELGLVFPNMSRAEAIGRAVEVLRESFHQADIALCGSL